MKKTLRRNKTHLKGGASYSAPRKTNFKKLHSNYGVQLNTTKPNISHFPNLHGSTFNFSNVKNRLSSTTTYDPAQKILPKTFPIAEPNSALALDTGLTPDPNRGISAAATGYSSNTGRLLNLASVYYSEIINTLPHGYSVIGPGDND